MNTMYLILEEYKTTLSTKKLILKYIKLRERLTFVVYFVLMISISVSAIIMDNNWLLIPFYVILVIFIVHFFRVTKKIISLKYGSKDDYQKERYKLLIDILEKHKIASDDTTLTKEKINILINSINSKLVFSKKNIPILGIISTIITTLLKMGLDTFLGNKYPKDLFIIIFFVMLMTVGIFMMAWPIILEFLNRDNNKMEELRNMLYEILLNDQIFINRYHKVSHNVFGVHELGLRRTVPGRRPSLASCLSE